MVGTLERSVLEFAEAAAQTPLRRTVTVNLDADVLQFLEAEGLKLDDNINGLLRFYMDTSQQKELEFASGSWEPGGMDLTTPNPDPF